jgi:(E)-4-hydroxy-3-methylbut-2-enyl-diphosphate synthase
MNYSPDSARRKSSVVRIGAVPMGGDFPVRVQSMTNRSTRDTEACVEQIIRIARAGGEYVRLAAQGVREAENLRNIREELRRRGYEIPLIADVHFNAAAAEVAARYVEKVRINPGNFIASIQKGGAGYTDELFERERLLLRERFGRFLEVCRQHDTAVRIGVNHGSLSERMMSRYGDTPLGMVESCMELLRMSRELQFDSIVVSLKASNTVLMIHAVRMLVERMEAEDFHFPLHLGVTEAGEGEDGRIKSAIGMGSLLADGIGDTLRVSLSEDPEREIPVAFAILQAARRRITKTEYVSCPGCGRTLFDLQAAVRKVKSATEHLKGLKIAVMGCIVNGPGEMADADYGYVGAGAGRVNLYKGRECVLRNVPEADAVGELLRLCAGDGTALL